MGPVAHLDGWELGNPLGVVAIWASPTLTLGGEPLGHQDGVLSSQELLGTLPTGCPPSTHHHLTRPWRSTLKPQRGLWCAMPRSRLGGGGADGRLPGL